MPELTPCSQCPWRASNQGKRTPWGFYSQANLRRMWNEIRNGCGVQSCHPTDASHPDHVAAGAKTGAQVKECAGSVILVLRELIDLRGGPDVIIGPEEVDAYLARRKRGLKKRALLYYLYERMRLADVPFFGGTRMPDVNVNDKRISLPTYLEG